MKAEFNDRLYTKKPKSKISKWPILGCLALVLIGGAVYLNNKVILSSEGARNTIVNLLKSPFQKQDELGSTASQYAEQAQPLAVITKSPAAEMRQNERLVYEQTQGQSKPRQTIFNEDNYVPRGARNIVVASASNHVTSRPQALRTQRAQRFSTTHWANWRWESYGSGFNTKTRSGRFSYIETERGIDTTSICANYTRGSLVYRDCRKAAKQWFKDRCSANFRQACLAGNMIP